MTSMSQMSAASRMSPNARMQQALQTAVTSGTVKSTDQTALSGALDSIDTAMKSSKPTAGSDPASKISDLIDQQVSDGKLTDDQATELKQLFTDNAPKRPGESNAAATDGSDEVSSVDGTSGTERMGGPGGPGGPPPGPPPSGDSSDASSDDGTSTSSTDSANAMIEKMIAFLKKLEEANSSTTNYGSNGTSATSSYSSMLVDSAA